MRVALYVRVSTQRQVQQQTIAQQLERLQTHLHLQEWTPTSVEICRDDG